MIDRRRMPSATRPVDEVARIVRAAVHHRIAHRATMLALSGRPPSSATIPAMPHIRRRARAAAGSCARRRVARTRARTAPWRWRRRSRRASRPSSAVRMPSASAAGSGSTRKQTSSVKHLRVRPDPCRDERHAARQLLVDLERCVRAMKPRRDQDIGESRSDASASVLGTRPGSRQRSPRPSVSASSAGSRPAPACRRRAAGRGGLAFHDERERHDQQNVEPW